MLKKDVSGLESDPTGCSIVNVSLLASGGFNDVWLAQKEPRDAQGGRYIAQSAKRNVLLILVRTSSALSLRLLRTLRIFPRKDIAREAYQTQG